jgi:hypothetical protein
MEIILSGAIANFSGLTNHQFLDYLKERAKEFEYYQLQPESGSIYAAALDWKAIGNISSLLGIVSFVWMAYSELINPKKEPDSNSGIIIKIENGSSHNQFWIGNTINSKEELIDTVGQFLRQGQFNNAEIKKQIDSIKNSGYWKRVK